MADLGDAVKEHEPSHEQSEKQSSQIVEHVAVHGPNR
jgi:hypothetical protein